MWSSLKCACSARDVFKCCCVPVLACKHAQSSPLVHVVGARCWPGRFAAGLRAVHRLCRGPQLHGWLLRCVPSTIGWGFCRCAVWAVCLVRGCLLPLVVLLLLLLLGLCCQWRLCIVCRIPELLDIVC